MGKHTEPKCPGCNGPVNANCSNDNCWNSNSKRHDGINRIAP